MAPFYFIMEFDFTQINTNMKKVLERMWFEPEIYS